MLKNSIDKDFLYDLIGEFEDELVEKAADYKKSSRILSFPIYKYVNAVAAFLICIISTIVFVQLKPVNEINETLIIPTNQPKITATPDITAKPEETNVPNETEKPKSTERPINMSVVSEVPELIKGFDNKYESDTIVPPIIGGGNATEAPSVTLKPGRVPNATKKPIQTKEPNGNVETTKKPESTNVPIATLKPTEVPIITPKPTGAPATTLKPTEVPLITTEPTEVPVAKPTKKPVIPSKPTETPIITTEPTPVPTKTASPIGTNQPTPTPPIGTSAPTPTPPIGTSKPTPTPPIWTSAPTPPIGTSAPTPTPPIGTSAPTPTPPIWTSAPTPTPTPEPTAPPLDIEECTAVEGDSVVIRELNGATYDADKEMIEFTDESVANRLGVEIINPIAGDTNMISDYGYLMDVNTNGLLNAFHLTGSNLGWETDGEKLPVPEGQMYNGKPLYDMDLRIKSLLYTDVSTVYYPKPENKTGFSISFWANTSREEEKGPAVTFINDRQCIVVSINGNVDYVDADDRRNRFAADSDNYCRPGEWHYYTITYANDWITYYVDGIEVPYSDVQLVSRSIKSFNDGFLTRYNPAVTWSEEDYQNDWRGYLSKQRAIYEDERLITGMKYTVMNVSRYLGFNNSKKILLNFMASPDTKVLLGGGMLEYNHLIATYYRNVGTMFAQVKYYNVELTNKNVYANYHEALKSKPD